jgi:hypothetical protein
VNWAAKHKAILCHTLDAPKIRAAVPEPAQRLAVPTTDILGPMLPYSTITWEFDRAVRQGYPTSSTKSNSTASTPWILRWPMTTDTAEVAHEIISMIAK